MFDNGLPWLGHYQAWGYSVFMEDTICCVWSKALVDLKDWATRPPDATISQPIVKTKFS